MDDDDSETPRTTESILDDRDLLTAIAEGHEQALVC